MGSSGGTIWSQAEDAEEDLGVQFEVLNERSLYHGNLSWLVWQRRGRRGGGEGRGTADKLERELFSPSYDDSPL
jgi:hypothetical protein